MEINIVILKNFVAAMPVYSLSGIVKLIMILVKYRDILIKFDRANGKSKGNVQPLIATLQFTEIDIAELNFAPGRERDFNIAVKNLTAQINSFISIIETPTLERGHNLPKYGLNSCI